ncbi:Crp/Fnr family transcriptional regulator [Saccharicrinis sp. FJH2]|uniref:Crp/Fnr family transcriptional regulator n=1 Tax=Saccharicrinis sp. FJH65 TaxID=3344659 RepID=UPI0035F472C0
MIQEIINSVCPISTSSITKLEELAHFEDIKKGETFIKRNKKDKKEYFVLEGVCRSYLVNPEGDEITLSFFISNSILSPNTIRTKNELSVFNFQALTEVKIVSIDTCEFEELMISNLEIRQFGNFVLRNELAVKIEKEIGLATLTAKERLINFRKQFPNLENLIPHSDIASYLGITNISLSRLRKDLVK